MKAMQMLISLPDRLLSDRKTELMMVSSLCFGISSLILLNIDKMWLSSSSFYGNIGDHQKYLYMAQHDPFGLYFAPFGWRIGLPFLVKLLPLGVEQGFLVISFLSVACTGIVLYYILQKFVTDKYVCMTGILFYLGLGWAVFMGIYDFWLPDSLALFMIVLALYFILIKNDFGFLLTILLGVFVRESVLAVVPLYYTFNADKLADIKALKRLTMLAFPGVAALACIRWLIPGASTDAAYLSALAPDLQQIYYNPIASYSTILGIRAAQFQTLDLTFKNLPAYLLDPFGITVLVLFIIGACVRRDILYKFLPFMAVVIISLFMGGDIGRYLIVMFPAAILLACCAMVWARGKFVVKQYYFIVTAVIIILLHLVWHFYVPAQIEFTMVLLGLFSCFMLDRTVLSPDSFVRSFLSGHFLLGREFKNEDRR